MSMGRVSALVICCALLLQRPSSAQTPALSAAEKPHEAVSKPSDHPDPDHPTPAAINENTGGDDTDEGFALKRSQWFVQQRAYPFAHIPAGARWLSLQQKSALLSSPRALNAGGISPQSAFTSNTWTFDGPQPFAYGTGYTPNSGRATSIAINPTTPSTIYLGTAAGGVWKSTDSGTTWNPLTDSQASLAIGALAIDPLNTNTIYSGTGEPDSSTDSYYGQGLLKSTDGGNTWTLIRSPFTSGTTAPDFTQIVLQPNCKAPAQAQAREPSSRSHTSV